MAKSVEDELFASRQLWHVPVFADVEAAVAAEYQEGAGSGGYNGPTKQDHVIVETFFQFVDARLRWRAKLDALARPESGTATHA